MQNKLSHLKLSILLALSCIFSALQPITVSAQTFLSSGDMTDSKWYVIPTDKETTGGDSQTKSGGEEQGTLEFHPSLGGNPAYTRFNLISYNPHFPGDYMLGPQVRTAKAFQGLKGGTVTFEAKMRFPIIRTTGGIVSGFLPYSQDGYANGQPTGWNEIDMEFLHKQLHVGKIWTNVYKNYNTFNGERLDEFYNYDGSNLAPAPDSNWSAWKTYKITWSAKRIDWFVNGVRIKKIAFGPAIDNNSNLTQFDGAVPIADYTKALNVFLNIWSPRPNSPWQQAADSASPKLEPASSASQSQTWYFDVQWVKVSGAKQVKSKLKVYSK